MIHHGETEIAPIFRTDSSVLIQKELSLMPMPLRDLVQALPMLYVVATSVISLAVCVQRVLEMAIRRVFAAAALVYVSVQIHNFLLDCVFLGFGSVLRG